MQSFIPDSVSLEQLSALVETKQPPTVELTADSYIDAGYDMLEQLPDDWKTINHISALAFTLVNHLGLFYEDLAQKYANDNSYDHAMHCAMKSGQFNNILTALGQATNVGN